MTVSLTVFECHCDLTKPGDQLFIVGSEKELGQWNPGNAVELSTNGDRFPLWYSPALPITDANNCSAAQVEFKFLIRTNRMEYQWETCENRTFVGLYENGLPASTIRCTFNIRDTNILASSKAGPTDSPLSTDGDVDTFFPHPCDAHDVDTLDPHKVSVLAAIFQSEREGKTKSFRQKLALCKQLIEGLVQEAIRTPNCIEILKETDVPQRIRRDGSLNYEVPAKIVETLGSIALYFNEVSSQNIRCEEDGQHYRPCAHAQESKSLSLIIRGLVSTMATDPFTIGVCPSQRHSALRAGSNVEHFCRAILPHLTSFDSQFTAAQPLTRIRDIAHRNDIDQGLKREIKTTLQNKLHRCAGPEDLTTCKNFVARFRANPGMVNDNFMQEFLKFESELEEFFNAKSVQDKINQFERDACQALGPLNAHVAVKDTEIRSIAGGLKAVSSTIQRLSQTHDRNDSQRLDWIYHDLVEGATAREGLQRVDHACATYFKPETTPSGEELSVLGHAMACIDVGVEQAVFALISLGENLLGRSTELSVGHRIVTATKLLEATMRHVSLCGIARNDSRELANLFKVCWASMESLPNFLQGETVTEEERTEIVILRGALKRLELLQTSFIDSIVDTTAFLASYALTSSKGILNDSSSGQRWAEDQIRRSLVFQASKIRAIARNAIKLKVKEVLFDTVVPGAPRGYLVRLDSLMWLENNESDENTPQTITTNPPLADVAALAPIENADQVESIPLILWVAEIDGDEELIGMGEQLTQLLNRTVKDQATHPVPPVHIAGIICDHLVPALSHVGVRARALKMPLACFNDPKSAAAMRAQHLSQYVEVDFERLEGPPFTVVADETPIPEKIFPGQAELEKSPQRPAPADGPVREPGAIELENGHVPFFGVDDEAWSRTQVGPKAKNCKDLMLSSAKAFHAPACQCLPFDALEKLMALYGTEDLAKVLSTYNRGFSCSDLAEEWARDIREGIQLMKSGMPAKDQRTFVEACVAGFLPIESAMLSVMIRSSSNVEDVDGVTTGAGLFESIPVTLEMKDGQMTDESVDAFMTNLLLVYASLFSSRAVKSFARVADVGTTMPQMAVLLQPVEGPPEMAFVLHTEAPFLTLPSDIQEISARPSDWIYAELACGMGEILAGAKFAGNPYAMLVLKEDRGEYPKGTFALITGSSFGVKLVPPKEGSLLGNTTLTLNYPAEDLLLNRDIRKRMADAVCRSSMQLEQYFSCPQDIEGFFTFGAGTEVLSFIVQSRPQPLAE